MKDILKGLREFKKSSNVAFEMLKVFSEGSESSAVSFSFWDKNETENTTTKLALYHAK